MKTKSFDKKTVKTITMVLFGILLLGLCVYWTGYTVADRFFQIEGTLTEKQWSELAMKRRHLHQTVTGIQGICEILFFAGLLYLIPVFWKLCPIPVKKIWSNFLSAEVLMIAGAGIFSAVNADIAGDYFYPVLNVSLYLAVFVVIFLVMNFMRSKRSG